MGNTLVEAQVMDVAERLQKVVRILERFLNETTLNQIANENPNKLHYYKRLFRQTRKLLVYSEEGLEAVQLILSHSPFPKALAEKTLFKIYHQCVEEFFSPKSDIWHENSRAAYTGKDAICFHDEVPKSVSVLFQQLEGDFQHLREELEYYETDFKTKYLQAGQE